MLLYHGSNIPVPKPRLLIPERPMDFGSGFYLTSDLNQAQNPPFHPFRRSLA